MIQVFPRFKSKFALPRQVEVWLPDGFENGREHYPVLYMHDGQNVFNPETSTLKIPWAVDKAMERLTQEQKVRPAIVVASWCTDKRTREYMPQAPLEQPENASLRDAFIKHFGAAPISDGYLRFLVEELKPWVDDHYRTLPDPAHTFIMGSSMGGLISLYALCRYPNVFGGAGCISTHWTIGAGLTHGFAPDGVWRIQPYHAMSNNALIAYFSAHLPAPGTHKIYFDLGTAGLDEFYPPWQVQMDAHMRTAGYTEYVNWLTNAFPGEHHNEAAWRDRVHVPLQFLLGTDSDTVKA